LSSKARFPIHIAFYLSTLTSYRHSRLEKHKLTAELSLSLRTVNEFFHITTV